MRAVPVALLTTAILAATPAIAIAGGSDAPTPYTVTAAGVTLPTGTTYVDGGHVNYRATALDGTGSRSFGTHFESLNNRPSGKYIGTSFYDFNGAATAFPDGYCVTWVQVAEYDEHFGEGGQKPVCTTDKTTPETPGTPLVPVVPGAELPTDEESPAVPGTPKGPDEVTTPPAADGEPDEPITVPRETTEVPVSDAADPVNLEGAALVSNSVSAEKEDGLAATGSNAMLIAAGAAALLAAGVGAVLVGRRVQRG
ncbi:hypothetical protein ACFWGN_16950 [Oerskovia sp. NPDC060338]|uniref:hypothetical protein n=1 Tax=Oerskovia sp. NPDC060338 TaxID=3347100 RepID=UPI00364683A7